MYHTCNTHVKHLLVHVYIGGVDILEKNYIAEKIFPVQRNRTKFMQQNISAPHFSKN